MFHNVFLVHFVSLLNSNLSFLIKWKNNVSTSNDIVACWTDICNNFFMINLWPNIYRWIKAILFKVKYKESKSDCPLINNEMFIKKTAWKVTCFWSKYGIAALCQTMRDCCWIINLLQNKWIDISSQIKDSCVIPETRNVIQCYYYKVLLHTALYDHVCKACNHKN